MTKNQAQLKCVSKIKKYLEEKAHRELVAIQNKREVETENLNNLIKVNDAAIAETRQTISANARDLQYHQAYLRSLSHQIQEQEEVIENIIDQEDDKRVELTEKTKSKKIIEKLNEKHSEEIANENEKILQNQIDVLAQRIKIVF